MLQILWLETALRSANKIQVSRVWIKQLRI